MATFWALADIRSKRRHWVFKKPRKVGFCAVKLNVRNKNWENIPEMSEEVSKIWVNASACHIRLRLLGGSVSQCQPYGNYRWKLTSNWRPRATIWSGRPPVLITLNRGCSAPRHCRRRGRKADKWEEPLLICTSHQNLSFHIIFHHIKTKIIANDLWQEIRTYSWGLREPYLHPLAPFQYPLANAPPLQ